MRLRTKGRMPPVVMWLTFIVAPGCGALLGHALGLGR